MNISAPHKEHKVSVSSVPNNVGSNAIDIRAKEIVLTYNTQTSLKIKLLISPKKMKARIYSNCGLDRLEGSKNNERKTLINNMIAPPIHNIHNHVVSRFVIRTSYRLQLQKLPVHFRTIQHLPLTLQDPQLHPVRMHHLLRM